MIEPCKNMCMHLYSRVPKRPKTSRYLIHIIYPATRRKHALAEAHLYKESSGDAPSAVRAARADGRGDAPALAPGSPQRREARALCSQGDGGQDAVVTRRPGCRLRAQGGRAEDRSERCTWCAHCQVGVHACCGVIEVCARASEAGSIPPSIGSSSGVRALTCSRGWCRTASSRDSPPWR